MWKKNKVMRSKILVVDDEEDVAVALKVRLKANGYEVVWANDSVQAFMMVQREKPNLIILDIMVPGGGGFAIADRLKKSLDTRDIPIIFLTGIAGSEERAYQAGARFYLMKPYDPPVLLDAVKRAMNASQGPVG